MLWGGQSWPQAGFQPAGPARMRVRSLKGCPAFPVQGISQGATLGGQPQAGDAPRAVGPILQHQGAAVPLGDLATEDQTDTAAAGLGGKERDEEIGGAG